MGGKTHVMVVRESQGHQHSVLSDFLVIVTRPTCLGGEMYQYNKARSSEFVTFLKSVITLVLYEYVTKC